MVQHADVLDQPENLGKPFVGALFLHISIAAAILAYSWIGPGAHVPFMGDPNGGGMGSVAVGVTRTIPLPNRGGPQNPVANDTESQVKAPPPKPKAVPKVKTPPPDAIPIKGRDVPKKHADRDYSPPNKFRESQKDTPNQLYTTGGQAVSSPMYNMPGGGGVGVGNNSPFGQQFGWYATLIRDKVAQSWKTADIDARITSAPIVTVTFTIRRDGSLTPGSVRVSQRSGNSALDISAQRAVLDAAPFSGLPPQFPRNEAAVELQFQLRR